MKLAWIFPLSRHAACSFAPLAFVAMSTLAVGCAAETAEPEESQASEELGEISDDLAVSSAKNFGYFIVTRRDTRRCAAPLCGGFFVKRVNERLTTCADGSKQAECYVSAIQLGGVNLSTREEAEARDAIENGKAVLKARTYKTAARGSIVGVLKANEVWRGVSGGAADGTFYRVVDNGIRCITTPCPSTSAFLLNGSDSHTLTEVRFERTLAPSHTLEAARNAIASDDGILVAGGVSIPRCLPGATCGAMLSTTEIYTRVVRTEGKACAGRTAKPTVCNEGQACFFTDEAICGRADARGTCAYRPDACTMIYQPVCGCDHTTYGNACAARVAGVSVLAHGECPDTFE